MIAKTRGPLSVKKHSFAVYAPTPRGGTIGLGKSRALLITPLLEQSGFSFLCSLNRTSPKRSSEKFATLSNAQVTAKIVPRVECAAPSKPCKLIALANGAGVRTPFLPPSP